MTTRACRELVECDKRGTARHFVSAARLRAQAVEVTREERRFADVARAA
jgi:hypothetical protein